MLKKILSVFSKGNARDTKVLGTSDGYITMYVPIHMRVRGPANIVFSPEDMMRYSSKELVLIMSGRLDDPRDNVHDHDMSEYYRMCS